MAIEIRRVRPDEVAKFVAVERDAFSSFFSGDEENEQRLLDGALLHAAYDNEMIGTAGAFDFDVIVPGGEIKAAGITMVGVLPTHRRRGALTGLMRAQLEDVHRYKRPIAMLFASEAAIYPRFGYGLASLQLELRAERKLVTWRNPAPAASFRLLDHAAALETLPPIYERARIRPGMPARSERWWDLHRLLDDERERRGDGPLYRVLASDEKGHHIGYALYRPKLRWDEGVTAGRLEVVEAIADTPAGEEAVWRYLFGVDLIAEVHTYFQPIDSALLLLVGEPARLHPVVHDALWVRVVDVEAALRERGYAASGRIVIEVSDPLCPWNNGRWVLDTDGSNPLVERTDDPPELRAGIEALGSAYLGGFGFSDLVRAGRIEQVGAGAAARADTMFRTDSAPWCPEIF